MRIRLIAEHHPEAEGTASGRMFRAAGQGLVDAGHDVVGISWKETPPTEELPPWSTWRPVHCHEGLVAHAKALARPRWNSADLHLEDDGSFAFAEDPLSYAAVARQRRNGVVLHYSVLLDARASGKVTLRDVQGHRGDRRALRGADLPLTYSRRAAEPVGTATFVPSAVEVPDELLPLRSAPTAVLLAGWNWRPNVAALQTLLGQWSHVRELCPGAELVVAGRGAPQVSEPGVRVIGEVARAVDAFAEGSVLAFPCPPSSGPKTKVLEAMAAGLPVVTTEHGAEGLADPTACEVVDEPGFAARLAAVLADEARRADLARRGRAMVLGEHSPEAAARTRMALFSRYDV